MIAASIECVQIVRREEFLGDMTGRELSPEIIVLADIEQNVALEAARKALALKYQRVVLRGDKIGDIENGVETWVYPRVPAPMNMGPGLFLYSIARKYLDSGYDHDCISWKFAADFVTEVGAMEDLDGFLAAAVARFDGIDLLTAAASHGAGRNAEREDIARELIRIGVEKDGMLTVPSTKYNDNVLAIRDTVTFI